MGQNREGERIAAACEECGSVYPAYSAPDKIVILGTKSENCPCGSNEFINLTARATEEPAEYVDAEESD